MNDHYAWAGGDELLHLWPARPLSEPAHDSVIIALPPFEEASRLRALAATIARTLSERRIAVAIPDLPGTGESLVATGDARLTEWRDAFAAAARALPGRVHGVAFRAGALIDGEADLASRWLLSPQGGPLLVRELERLRQLGDGLVAGNAVADEMLDQLSEAEAATGGPLRVVRLATEAQPADRKVEAAPLWRRAEPDNDPALAELLADDISDWIALCGA